MCTWAAHPGDGFAQPRTAAVAATTQSRLRSTHEPSRHERPRRLERLWFALGSTTSTSSQKAANSSQWSAACRVRQTRRPSRSARVRPRGDDRRRRPSRRRTALVHRGRPARSRCEAPSCGLGPRPKRLGALVAPNPAAARQSWPVKPRRRTRERASVGLVTLAVRRPRSTPATFVVRSIVPVPARVSRSEWFDADPAVAEEEPQVVGVRSQQENWPGQQQGCCGNDGVNRHVAPLPSRRRYVSS